MLFHLGLKTCQFHIKQFCSWFSLVSLPDRYKIASNISISLRIEGNYIFKGWDSIKQIRVFVCALVRKQNTLTGTSCLYDQLCGESSTEALSLIFPDGASTTSTDTGKHKMLSRTHLNSKLAIDQRRYQSFVHMLIQTITFLATDLAHPNLFQKILIFFTCFNCFETV